VIAFIEKCKLQRKMYEITIIDRHNDDGH